MADTDPKSSNENAQPQQAAPPHGPVNKDITATFPISAGPPKGPENRTIALSRDCECKGVKHD
jgi:hypothetical protein